MCIFSICIVYTLHPNIDTMEGREQNTSLKEVRLILKNGVPSPGSDEEMFVAPNHNLSGLTSSTAAGIFCHGNGINSNIR